MNYSRLCLSSSWLGLRLRTNLTNQCFIHKIVLLIYVNETMNLFGNLPFFKIHVNHIMARDNSPCANVISKCMLCVRDQIGVSEF